MAGSSDCPQITAAGPQCAGGGAARPVCGGPCCAGVSGLGVPPPRGPWIPPPWVPGVPHSGDPGVPELGYPGVQCPNDPWVPHPTNPGVSHPSSPRIPGPRDPRVPHPGVPHPEDAKVPHFGDPRVPCPSDPSVPHLTSPGVSHPSNPGVPAPGDAGVPHPGVLGIPGAVDVPVGTARGCRVDHGVPPAPVLRVVHPTPCQHPWAGAKVRVADQSPRAGHGEEGVRDQRILSPLGRDREPGRAPAPWRPQGWCGSGGAGMAAAQAASRGFGELVGDSCAGSKGARGHSTSWGQTWGS